MIGIDARLIPPYTTKATNLQTYKLICYAIFLIPNPLINLSFTALTISPIQFLRTHALKGWATKSTRRFNDRLSFFRTSIRREMFDFKYPTPRIRNIIDKLCFGLSFQSLNMSNKPRILHINNRSSCLLWHRPTFFEGDDCRNIQPTPHRRFNSLVWIYGTDLQIEYNDGARDIGDWTDLREVDRLDESDLTVSFTTNNEIWNSANVSTGENCWHGRDGPVCAVVLCGEIEGSVGRGADDRSRRSRFTLL